MNSIDIKARALGRVRAFAPLVLLSSILFMQVEFLGAQNMRKPFDVEVRQDESRGLTITDRFFGNLNVYVSAMDKSHTILAAAGFQPGIILWRSFADQKTRRMHELDPSKGPVRKLVFAKLGDGKTCLVSGDAFGMIRLWSVETCKEIASFKPYEHGNVSALAFSEKDGRLVSCGWSKSGDHLRVWDLRERRLIKGARFENIHYLAFSADGERLALAGERGELHVLKYPSLEKLWSHAPKDRKSARHSGRSVDFGPDGKSIVTPDFGRPDSWIRLWHADTGLPKARIAAHPIDWELRFPPSEHAYRNGISKVHFSPSGLLLVTTGTDYKAFVFEIATKQTLAVLAPRREGAVGFCSVHFYGGDNQLLGVGYQGDLMLCDLDRVKPSISTPQEKSSAAFLGRCWEDLQSSSVSIGSGAVELLLRQPRQTAPWLKLQVMNQVHHDYKKLSKHINDLGSVNFETRRRAFSELNKNLYHAEPLLRSCRSETTDLEARKRIDNLLSQILKLENGVKPLELRPLRVISILERIDSADARETLAWMAEHEPSELVRSEAKRALRKD